EHPPIGEGRRCKLFTGLRRGGGECPGARAWVVELRAGEVGTPGVADHTADDEHATIRQQSGRMVAPFSAHGARGRPSAAAWIVHFGAGKVTVVPTPRDEDTPIGEERRRRLGASSGHRVSSGPAARARVVELGAGEDAG